jgi:curved DNA-binding protein CbpA
VLGLAPPATLDEIRAAYRELIKEVHPDRLASGSPGLRAFAEEQAKAINAAYELLVSRHDRSGTTE